jgi:hypothetical protein
MEINGAIPQTVSVPSPAPRVAPPPAGRTAVAPSSGSPPPIPSDIAKALGSGGSGDLPGGARIRVDKATDRVVLQILDANNTVVKQIPAEAFLHAVEQARNVTGLILDQQT